LLEVAWEMLVVMVFLRGSRGEYIDSFTSFVSIQNYLYVEIMGVILAIEISCSTGCKRVWLECDSALLCQTFSSPLIFPCLL